MRGLSCKQLLWNTFVVIKTIYRWIEYILFIVLGLYLFYEYSQIWWNGMTYHLLLDKWCESNIQNLGVSAIHFVMIACILLLVFISLRLVNWLDSSIKDMFNSVYYSIYNLVIDIRITRASHNRF